MARLRHTQRGTGLVEYGLVLGAVSVLVIVGLNSLSLAQARYFSSLGPSVAAPPPASVSGPRHSTAVEQLSGTPGPQCPASAVSGDLVICTAYVHDTSATAQMSAPDRTAAAPPTGQVTWYMNQTPVATCAGLTPVPPDASKCPLTTPMPYTATMAIRAAYDPQGTNFLDSQSQATVTVLIPTPTATPTPTSTPTPVPPTPTPTLVPPTPCPEHAACSSQLGPPGDDAHASAPQPPQD
jgi:Flp pilus assembly pilin Flp